MIETMQSYKNWKLAKEPSKALFSQLKEELEVDDLIIRLLIQRGIHTYEEAKSFFNPGVSQLHDPFLMNGMLDAVTRIHKAVENEEHILIFGDYDVDGTTSVALAYSYFKQIFPNRIHYHIPDRYEEGYGISVFGIDRAASLNCKLIIALDCGVRSVDKVEYAKSLGIDFIICDHHLPGDELPDAIAVLDPKKPGCDYPFKELSGAGVGFKLIQAYNQLHSVEEDVLHYLDLVTLSIAADIVSLTGENRSLASLGLTLINEGKSINIQKILQAREKNPEQNSKKDVGISDLVFKVAPLINSAGRIDHGSAAVDLLLADSTIKFNNALHKIKAFNQERVDLDKRITREAIAMIDSSPIRKEASSTVLFKEDWHKGVVGIVASRVIEKYYRPTIILTLSKGVITGSARSVKGFNIHEAISRCSQYLEQFGGHEAAAGLTMLPEKLSGFAAKFEEVVQEMIQEDQKVEHVDINLEIEPRDITPGVYKILKRFAPFGPNNMAPVFMSKGLVDFGYAKIVGDNHLKMKLGKPNQPYFDAIGFNLGNYESALRQGIPVDVCFTLDENHFNGKITLQWIVKDIKC